MTRSIVSVQHRRKERTVGVTVFHGDGLLFLHEDHGNGTEWHHKTNSPGGIDQILVDWMKKENVNNYCISTVLNNKPICLCADVETIEACSERFNWDGRERLFLPLSFWKEIAPPANPFDEDIKRVKLVV